MRLAKVIPLAPREDIVAELEVMLEAAKRGEIVGLAYANISARGKTVVGFSAAGSARFLTLMGATDVLKRRLSEAYDEF